MSELECNNQTLHFGSLTRIADLHKKPFVISATPTETWATGDYAVGRYMMNKDNHVDQLELCDGSLKPLKAGDMVVGALGERCATQEVVGSWKLINNDAIMQQICGSGMFGVVTSRSPWYNTPSAKFKYEGHCFRHNHKLSMRDYAPNIVMSMPTCPMILIVGTSMSCGKTISAKIIIDTIRNHLGFQKIVGTKFTGGGYKHDTSEMLKAGAFRVVDFIDAGFCSTLMPPDEFRESALPTMLGLLSEIKADCIVGELGASPLEPYNGFEVLKALLGSYSYPAKIFTVLCATDAYAVYGLCSALRDKGLEFTPNLVCGMATNNSAGIALVNQLTRLPALNLESSSDELCKLLKESLLR